MCILFLKVTAAAGLKFFLFSDSYMPQRGLTGQILVFFLWRTFIRVN